MTWHLISRVITGTKTPCRAGVIHPMSDNLPLLRDGNRLRSISQRRQRALRTTDIPAGTGALPGA